jgi:hypothetical protein
LFVEKRWGIEDVSLWDQPRKSKRAKEQKDRSKAVRLDEVVDGRDGWMSTKLYEEVNGE